MYQTIQLMIRVIRKNKRKLFFKLVVMPGWMTVNILLTVTTIDKLPTLQAQTSKKVVAVVEGRQITQEEVDKTVTLQLFPLEQQIYAIRKVALENLILRLILENEAKKRGITVNSLRKQLTVGEVEISAAEVERFYSENASVLGAMSPDEARERLRLDLESQARMKLYRDALAALKKSVPLELFLDEPKLSVIDEELSPSKGSSQAKVTVVEFSDFQCPYCRGSQDVLKQILKSYPNDVRLVFKHLPLNIHSEAFGAAQAAFCAGEQGRFWQYQDALFSSESLSPEVFKKTASILGLDLLKFGTCMTSEAASSAITKDIAEAKALGINSTPTFIINGRLFRGELSLVDFQAAIQQELKANEGASLSPR